MTTLTQFAVSLTVVLVAGLFLVITVWQAVARKLRERPVAARALAVKALCGMAVLSVAGFFLALSSYRLVTRTVPKVVDAGRKLIAETVSFGTTSILEGFGKSYDRFEAKWDAETLKQTRRLDITIANSAIEKTGDGQALKMTLHIKNNNPGAIDFNDVLLRQHLLIKDAKGLCFPIDRTERDDAKLPPGVLSRRGISINLPGDIVPTHLVSPGGELSLGTSSGDTPHTAPSPATREATPPR